MRDAGTIRDACITHALHLAAAHRACYTAQTVKIAYTVGVLVAIGVRGAERVVVKLTALTPCAGNDCRSPSYALRCSSGPCALVGEILRYTNTEIIPI